MLTSIYISRPVVSAEPLTILAELQGSDRYEHYPRAASGQRGPSHHGGDSDGLLPQADQECGPGARHSTNDIQNAGGESIIILRGHVQDARHVVRDEKTREEAESGRAYLQQAQ